MEDPAPAPRLAVVVLAWNCRIDALRCLDRLRPECRPGDAVILVDNGSADGTADAVAARHPWAEVVRNRANLGFAAGCNAGLRIALDRGFPFVLLLNPDAFPETGTLDLLVEHLRRNPRVGAVQPLLVRADDPRTIDGSGQELTRCLGARDAGMGRPVAEAPGRAGPVFGACAAAAALRSDALREAGLLDEGFFLLLEDMDLMFRLRMAGWEVHLLPAARVHHRRGISAGPTPGLPDRRRRFLLHRNTLALALRYAPAGRMLRRAPDLALRAAKAALLATGQRDARCLPLWLASLRRRPGARRAMAERGVDRWFPGGPVG